MLSLLLPITFGLSFLVGTTLAANTITFLNHCPHNLYFWVIGPKTAEYDWAYTIVPSNGGSIIHNMVANAGTSIKIRDLPHYRVGPPGIIQAEYNFNPEKQEFFYDFSVVDCKREVGPENQEYCPFIQGGVTMRVLGADPGVCRTAKCLAGGECEEKSVYLHHGSWHHEPSWHCKAGNDVVFETCTESVAPQTICEDSSHDHGHGLAPVLPPLEAQYPESNPPGHAPKHTRPVYTWVAPTWGTFNPPAPTYTPSSSADSYRNIPPTYPPPSQFPPGTICYDSGCRCFGTTQPWLFAFPDFPFRSDCPATWPYGLPKPVPGDGHQSSSSVDTHPVPNLDWPNGTVCYDKNCECYSTTQPELWPEWWQRGPKCSGVRPFSSRAEYRCMVRGECEV